MTADSATCVQFNEIADARIIRGRPVPECALWPAQVAGGFALGFAPAPQDLSLGASPDAGLAAGKGMKKGDAEASPLSIGRGH
jgi:hypothetical protein